jgi:DNA-binding NarL/FixJ family response regulator
MKLGKQQVQRKAIQLTTRETEVFEAIREGLSDKDMSEHLGISVRTTNTHITNLFVKLKCLSGYPYMNRILAVRYGIENRLIPPYMPLSKIQQSEIEVSAEIERGSWALVHTIDA